MESLWKILFGLKILVPMHALWLRPVFRINASKPVVCHASDWDINCSQGQ